MVDLGGKFYVKGKCLNWNPNELTFWISIYAESHDQYISIFYYTKYIKGFSNPSWEGHGFHLWDLGIWVLSGCLP